MLSLLCSWQEKISHLQAFVCFEPSSALFSFKEGNSPSSDIMPIVFFKKLWETIKDDFLALV